MKTCPPFMTCLHSTFLPGNQGTVVPLLRLRASRPTPSSSGLYRRVQGSSWKCRFIDATPVCHSHLTILMPLTPSLVKFQPSSVFLLYHSHPPPDGYSSPGCQELLQEASRPLAQVVAAEGLHHPLPPGQVSPQEPSLLQLALQPGHLGGPLLHQALHM